MARASRIIANHNFPLSKALQVQGVALIKVDENGWSEYRTSEIGKFIRILVHQFVNYSNEIKALNSEFGEFPGREAVEEIFPEFFERGIISTVFLGMFLENLLYDIAVDLKSKCFADKVSNKTIEVEFNDICQLIQGAPFRDVEAIARDLEKFRKTRKYYVHNKSKKLGSNPKEELELYTPASAVEFVHRFCQFLNTWHPRYQLTGVVCLVLADVFQEVRGYEINL